MKRFLLFIVAFAVSSPALLAQGTSYSTPVGNDLGPDLQMSNQVFFDPNANQEEDYEFRMEYRIEGGYVQNWQHSKTNLSRLYLHGGRIGMTFDFMLPKHFSFQTGLLYTLAYGKAQQKWGVIDDEESYAASDSIIHRVTEHWLAVPMRVYYNIKLWKKLNMFFWGGPQLMIGLAEIDNIDNQLPPKATEYYQSQDIHLDRYNRFENELYPVNIQIGVGGGFEWDSCRILAGYDFGLNNQVRDRTLADQHMWEWSWFVSFAYKLPIQK